MAAGWLHTRDLEKELYGVYQLGYFYYYTPTLLAILRSSLHSSLSIEKVVNWVGRIYGLSSDMQAWG